MCQSHLWKNPLREEYHMSCQNRREVPNFTAEIKALSWRGLQKLTQLGCIALSSEGWVEKWSEATVRVDETIGPTNSKVSFPLCPTDGASFLCTALEAHCRWSFATLPSMLLMRNLAVLTNAYAVIHHNCKKELQHKVKFFRSGQRTDYQITSNRGLWDQVWIRYEKLGAIIK